jgi:putative transposase
VKKEYQIQAQRAVEQFEAWADGNADPVQLTFDTPEMVRLAQQGLGELLPRVGKLIIENVMECEVEQLAGKRSRPDPKRSAYRWGSEAGYLIIDRQKVPVAKPRVRNVQHNREIPLGSYELFQRASLIEESVWQKIMYGLTTRSYKEVVQQFAEAYGLKKAPPANTSSKPVGKSWNNYSPAR